MISLMKYYSVTFANQLNEVALYNSYMSDLPDCYQMTLHNY